MNRTMRIAAAMLTAALALAAVAVPALGANDPTVPADECSGNPKAVGQPFGNNATDIGPSPVSDDPDTADIDAGAASEDNPGNSTGAKGAEKSQAPCNVVEE